MKRLYWRKMNYSNVLQPLSVCWFDVGFVFGHLAQHWQRQCNNLSIWSWQAKWKMFSICHCEPHLNTFFFFLPQTWGGKKCHVQTHMIRVLRIKIYRLCLCIVQQSWWQNWDKDWKVIIQVKSHLAAQSKCLNDHREQSLQSSVIVQKLHAFLFLRICVLTSHGHEWENPLSHWK